MQEGHQRRRCHRFVGLPLLLSHVFSYEGVPDAHAALRRALGRPGGVEGFAAAALSGQVPHAVRTGGLSDDSNGGGDDFGKFVPLHSDFVASVDRVVVTDGSGTRAAWSSAAISPPDALIVFRCASGLPSSDTNQLGLGELLISRKRTDYRLEQPPGGVPIVQTYRDFLMRYKGLSSVDLSGLTSLRSIADGFVCESIALTSVDLSGLTELTSIGDQCLHDCGNLTRLNLSGLTALTSVGSFMLYGCRRLETLDVSGLTALRHVSDGFLCECVGVSRLDLSQQRSLTSIGGSFLMGCRGVTELDLSGLTAVTSVGDSFVSGCLRLHSIDLSGLSAVTSVGESFIDGGACLATASQAEVDRLPIAIRQHLRR